MPGQTTFRFDAYLVGSGLRPEDPEKGATSDMCIPIFPAVDHPTGRAPFHPEPAFPFSNCYHWSGPDMWVNLKIKTGAFPREKGKFIWLPNGDAVTMQDVCGDDSAEMENNVARRQQDLAEGGFSPQEQTVPAAHVGLGTGPCNDVPSSVVVPDAPTTDDSSSTFSCRTGSIAGGNNWSDDGDAETDNLTQEDETACQPVVQIWLDIAGELKDGDIPDPMQFAQQYKALSSYVPCFSSIGRCAAHAAIVLVC